ncbi:hypothetical protein TruAng_002892 [Truncatella angustata]|nr:hypothetical protein TruAng_002892 [Truncatella angustata]
MMRFHRKSSPNETAAFDLDPNFPPINGTSVAGTGYMLKGVYIAAVHYQEKEGGIVHSLWTCDSTGHYVKGDGQGSWNVSAGIGAPIVHPQTGLAVINLGGDEEIGGFRVYFKDTHARTAGLRYTVSGGWAYDGFISQDQGLSLAVTADFRTSKRPTVMSPSIHTGDTQTIEAMIRTYSDAWEINTFPWLINAYLVSNQSKVMRQHITNDTDDKWKLYYIDEAPSWSLDAFDGDQTSLALLMNSDTDQNVYYIGTDGGLHELTGYNTTWNKTLREPDANWPLADEPNAPLALAHDNAHNRTWIYYMSNGTMTQVWRSNDNTWEKAIALAKFNSTSEEAEGPSSASSSGLSNEAKFGIGVGVGLGVPLLIAAIAASMHSHVKRSRAERNAERAAVEAAHADATNPHGAAMPLHSSVMASTTGGNPQSPAMTSTMRGSPTPNHSSAYWERGYWTNGQWVAAQPGVQSHASQVWAKPEGDWRQSHGYYENAPVAFSPDPYVQPMFEMPIEERTHEMSGDGQVTEMAAATPLAQDRSEDEAHK